MTRTDITELKKMLQVLGMALIIGGLAMAYQYGSRSEEQPSLVFTVTTASIAP